MPYCDSMPLSSTIVEDTSEDDGSSSQQDDEYASNTVQGQGFGNTHLSLSEGDDGEENDDQDQDGYEEDYTTDDLDEDEDAVDLVYTVEALRQLGVDWLEHPEYATHRLIVSQDNTLDTTKHAPVAEQYYHIMAQFIIPASAIFRDVILMGKEGQDQDQDQDIGDLDDDAEDDDDGSREREQQRLSCLRMVPESEASDIHFPQPTQGRPLPEGIAALPFLQATATSGSEHESDGNVTRVTPLPLLHLHIPHPEHFPELLKAIYDGNLARWEQDTFRPETIGPITQNVDRLECATALTLRCLKYFYRVRSTLAEEQIEDESMDALNELFERAMKANLLEPVIEE
ncbi:hypothetical protein BC939DRAFT_482423 [Gamsiella multidivaricata]|uniref:uncharacterized protein n=1 Tax=Gamsiella multidivaricata TaxID=101098 RepID=UPI0022210844|nr:uncharacterized protein BC939DRAFT_482423 [Gamsiella multidivaricata]KAG0358714.1 hypothetical protein BGZ54_010314 [Gamsiella multidivaricata]KAI7815966.1 hypothetical protein BC939DRAFT_482423 [Gamsiella multidivaricata]